MRTLRDKMRRSGAIPNPTDGTVTIRDDSPLMDAIVLGPLPEGQCYIVPRETWDDALQRCRCAAEGNSVEALVLEVAAALLGRIEVAKAVGQTAYRELTPGDRDTMAAHVGDAPIMEGDRVAVLEAKKWQGIYRFQARTATRRR